MIIDSHGGGGQAETKLEYTGWKRKYDEQQFIVIVPEGARENPAERAAFMKNSQTSR